MSKSTLTFSLCSLSLVGLSLSTELGNAIAYIFYETATIMSTVLKLQNVSTKEKKFSRIMFQSKAKGEIVFFCGYRCAHMLLFFLLTFTTCFSCNTLDKKRKCTKILKRFDVIQLNFFQSQMSIGFNDGTFTLPRIAFSTTGKYSPNKRGM